VQECRAFELLRGQADRVNYLVTKHAKVVAMTCTHAALKRREFLELGFRYDTLVMEESAQILEIETLLPMLLQKPQDGHNRLKRVRIPAPVMWRLPVTLVWPCSPRS
jgi:intron-binding protein aquarius